jgi:hypothetical protein
MKNTYYYSFKIRSGLTGWLETRLIWNWNQAEFKKIKEIKNSGNPIDLAWQDPVKNSVITSWLFF